MKLDPLTSAYLKVINENASNGKVEGQSLKVGAAFGDSSNEKNVKSFQKNTGTDKVKGEIENPEEAPAELTTAGSESEPKEVKKGEKLTLKDSKNPFDALYNKIISEDAFDFSTEDNTLTPDSDFGGPEGMGSSHEEESHEDEDEDFGDEEESEEGEVEDLESLVSQLKELVGKLESHLGGEESEEGDELGDDEEGYEEEDEEESDSFPPHSDEEEVNEESVEIEELPDSHGLSLTNKPAHTVKGAVPVKKKKASVVKGPKVTGKPEEFKNEAGVSSLQAKSSIDAKGVKVGKFVVDQGE
jgi:hypothetical protein